MASGIVAFVLCKPSTKCLALTKVSAMLVYKDKVQVRATREWLTALCNRRGGGDCLEEARNRLIEFGELESGIVDTMSVDSDDWDELRANLRRAALQLALEFVTCCRTGGPTTTHHGTDPIEVLRELDGFELPGEVSAKAAEGYAYWGLYPEQYVDAAHRVFAEFHPRETVVLGLRNIGTSLASVVEAVLANEGVKVRSFTLRPRGHPFERRVRLGPRLSDELLRHRESTFIVVDEGPGLSGSSMASVVVQLEEFGVASRNILLLPSYECDGSHFVNRPAAEIWGKCKRVVGHCDPRSVVGCDGPATLDVSAGAWRQRLGTGGLDEVAVQPQHERLKFLQRTKTGKHAKIIRFCGLGHHGKAIHERASVLQHCGIVPRVLGARHGMLELEFLAGSPMVNQPFDADATKTVADYVAFRQRELKRADVDSFDLLRDMARTNVRETLGDSALRSLAELELRGREDSGLCVCADGRMMPHEWLRTSRGLVKVDALDHGDDHFYPGPCDVCWDLAGAVVELRLDADRTRALLDRYVARTADTNAPKRLPFYHAAYLAFRLGYSTLAHRTLGPNEDGMRFAVLAKRYGRDLARLLGVAGDPSPLEIPRSAS